MGIAITYAIANLAVLGLFFGLCCSTWLFKTKPSLFFDPSFIAAVNAPKKKVPIINMISLTVSKLVTPPATELRGSNESN